ncbi:MAG: hypothetical protein IIC10_01805 [Proteobacteria bacterium]|nr:hypothetical protein [Pseudomonadota bacterium]
MPVISTSFNRFLLVLLLQIGLISVAKSQLPVLSAQQLQWLGERVFTNECASDDECLTSWNSGEDFPSLGIGHFIWFQQGQIEPFEETFPALLQHYHSRNVTLPPWIQALPGPDSPWRNRQQFYAEFNNAEMQQLRQFLATTKAVQVDFIVRRLQAALPMLLAVVDAQERRSLGTRFYRIAQSHAPYGIYALIDYVHFKGTGTRPQERYQGQGWGLLQVLRQMQGGPDTLYSFVVAATAILERRVANAPPERNEQRWLAGWHQRLQTYLPPAAEN